MPSDAWLTFAGMEIINAARTRAYAAEMLPTLRIITDCEDRHVDRVMHTLLDDSPYSNPRVDEAPWYDVDDPDSGNFLGLLPLGISGLTDSTRQAQVIQSVDDGGSITGQRKGTKEVRVRAMLLGTDMAAVEAGKTWLKMALDGACGDPCGRNALCFLAAIPDPSEALGDYAKGTIQLAQLIGEAGRWNLSAGTFTPAAQSRSLATPPAPEPLPCDEIFWHWTVSAMAGTELIFEAVADSGIVFTQSFFTSGQTETFTFSDKGLADRQVYSQFRVVQDRTVTVTKVEIEYRLPPEEGVCFNKYLRQLRDVQCIAGPTEINQYRPSAGAMEEVEFTFVAGTPHVYGAEKHIVTGDDMSLQGMVPGSPVFPLSKTIALCAAAKTPPLVLDPDVPAVPAPPRPAVPSTGAVQPTHYEPYAVYVPEEDIPLWTDAVPILTVRTSGQAARAVRVRFMPRPLSTQAPEDLDPCGACGSFVIDYIPPNSDFTLNGMDQRAYITQAGDVVTSADHLLSGLSDAELFEWPILSCGTGYYIIIDVAGTELAEVELSIATRE